MRYNLQTRETKGRVFDKTVYHFARVGSTNKLAFSLAEKGGKEGTVVLADEQFKGEGRTGREWFSPCGGLWFSLILRPNFLLNNTSMYPLMGATAVVRTIKKLTCLPACISLPNDILIREKKVGGVMCTIKIEERQVKFAILGVGVNLNVESFPASLQDLSTSLLLETHRLTSPLYFLDLFLEELEGLYALSQVDSLSFMDKAKEFIPQGAGIHESGYRYW
ncbi:biotin--[acetyl-CoA-carboxylase] ligase [Candidatus Aerophobetes bacterium]|nr:biotin--[acetyl-CoA-carboxylase] ligase [Candidatus Aerophobetes bacterium]